MGQTRRTVGQRDPLTRTNTTTADDIVCGNGNRTGSKRDLIETVDRALSRKPSLQQIWRCSLKG
jgi:hypothetical protein